MNKNIETYVTKRLDELANTKHKLFNLLQTANKPNNELDITEKKDIIKMKQEFYLVSGALAELEELKKTFRISE